MKKTLVLMCCVSLSTACGGPEDVNDPSHPTAPSGTAPSSPLDSANVAPAPGATTPASPITVTGQVLRTPGVPETAALVYIPGANRKAQPVDTQGGFTIPDVTPPYDLIVRIRNGGTTYARVYMGLTLTNPSVLSVSPLSNTRTQVQFAGKLTGQQSTPGTSRTFVTYAQPVPGERWDAASGAGGSIPDAAGAYSFNSYWSRANAEGSLFAYQYISEAGRPRNYVAYGRRDNVPFRTTSGLDFAMSPMTSSQLSVEITPAVGNVNSAVTLRMSHSPTLALDLESAEPTTPTVVFGVPEVPQTTFQLRGTMSTASQEASTLWFRSGVKPGDVVKAVVPLGLKIIAPYSNEKDVPLSSTLSWAQVPNALYSHRFSCGSTLVYIDQTTPQLVLPDLSPVGLALKPADSCYWLLEAFSPVRSADEMIGNDYQRQRERSLTETVYSTWDSLSFTLAK